MAATWAKQNLERDEDALRVGIERIKLVDEGNYPWYTNLIL